MGMYSPDLNPLPLYAPVRFRHASTPPPNCVRTLWMAPLQQNNLIFSVITIHLILA